MSGSTSRTRHSLGARRRFAASAAKLGDEAIAVQAGVSADTVAAWRRRFGFAKSAEVSDVTPDSHEVVLAGEEGAVLSGRWNPQHMKSVASSDAARWEKAAAMVKSGKMGVAEAAGVWAEANARTAGMSTAVKALSEQIVSESGGTKKEPVVIACNDGRQWECSRGGDRPSSDDDAIWKEMSKRCRDLAPKEAAEVIHQHRSESASNLRYGALAEIVGDISDLGHMSWGGHSLKPVTSWDGRDEEFDQARRLLGGKHQGSLQEGVVKLEAAQSACEMMRSAEIRLGESLLTAHDIAGGGRQVFDVNGELVGEVRNQLKATGVNYGRAVSRLINASNGNTGVFISLLRSSSRDKWLKSSDVAGKFQKDIPGPPHVRRLADDGPYKYEERAA